MGRHGGGSRSGGSSRGGSRSGGGSRGGGSSVRTSKTPFRGCYNRSYYDRRGRYHSYYTSDSNFGKKRGLNIFTIFSLVFITFHMFFMVGGMSMFFINFGRKVDGDVSRIKIEDTANVLSEEEEEKTMTLLTEVYQESGMPVTVYTDTFEWKQHYDYLEVYSEELYYRMGFDEDAMIILFTTDNNGEFYDWEYDMYCGDDTTACLSDKTFDKLLDNFQKGMASQNLYKALDYSWNSVMDELGKTSVDWSKAPILIFVIAFYAIFYVSILGSSKKNNDAYRYFKENPDKYESQPMTLYSECPSCGASNIEQRETCAYCGTLLKVGDSNVKFVDPE